jgi:hypothetical protein
MTDLSKITTPFGLLDEQTREALKAHGGPYEFFNGSAFVLSLSTTLENIDDGLTYRVKPQPPKPREWWAVGKHLHDNVEEARSFRIACADLSGDQSHLTSPIVRVREVLE